MKYLRFGLLASAIVFLHSAALAQTTILAWDFTGVSSPATTTATTLNGNLDSTNVLSRGAGAGASSGTNSFRTTGFKNEGISTANTDYFQFAVSATTGYTLSLSTINYSTIGTASYAAGAGASMQFAYSLDGTNFTLIGSAATTTVATLTAQTGINLTGVTALQSLADSTTVTFRFYASGQTTTGGWGFGSPASAGTNGLALLGTLTAPAVASLTWSGPGGGTWDTSATNFTSSTAAWDNTANASTKAIFATASQTVNVGTVIAGSVQFDASGITLTGGTITNGNGATALTTFVTNVSDTATIDSAINDGGKGFTKDGSGTLILGGTQTNLTGGITVTTGTLQSDTSAIGGKNITNNGTVNFAQGSNGSYTGTLTNNSAFIKSGAGNLTMSNAVSGTGTTSITGGTLTAGTDGTLSTGSLTMASGTTLDLATHNATVSGINLTGATITNVGTLTISGTGTLSTTADASSSSISGTTLALGSSAHTFSVADGAASTDLTINSAITGSGILTKSGLGTMALTGSNGSLTGGVTMGSNSGTIALGSSNALGTGITKLNGGTLSGNGSTLTVSGNTYQLQGGGGTISGSSNLTLNGNWDTTTGANTTRTLNVTNSGTTTLAGTFAIAATQTLATNVSTNLTMSGIISGATATGLTKTGAGTLTLSGANTFGGTTTITAGSLTLGATNTLPTAGLLNLNGGSLTLNGFSQSLGTLNVSANSTIDFSNLAASLTFADSHSITWSGALTLANYNSSTNQVRFGTSSLGLTGTQLGLISATGVGSFILDGSGYLTAVPEPSTYAAILGAVALAGVIIRRKRKAQPTV